MKVDWKQSPSHISLLKMFVKPRNIINNTSFYDVQVKLREKLSVAIDRLIVDGALQEAELNEAIYSVCTISQLKDYLREHKLPRSLNKEELSRQLVLHLPEVAASLIKEFKVLKCTQYGKDVINSYDNNKYIARDKTKEQTYKFLSERKIKDAYKTFASHERIYSHYSFEPDISDIEEMQVIINSCPDSLRHLSNDAIQKLRVALCMSIIWKTDSPHTWLDSELSHDISNEMAINHLMRNSEIKLDTSFRDDNYEIPIIFDNNDIESCDLCLKYNGMKLTKSHFPNFPLKDCSSITGCKFDVGLNLLDSDFIEDEDDDPVETLKILKIMLDNDLITAGEFQSKKMEILSRL